MKTLYEHRQKGGWGFWLTGAGLAVTAAMLVWMWRRPAEPGVEQAKWGLIAGVVVLGAVAVMMSSLTVRVEDDTIVVRYGGGLFRRRFAAGEAIFCKPVRNAWWFGWGIRYIGTGWLYNVAGLDAVEVRTREGRIYRIGTDEPQRLCEAIRMAAGLDMPVQGG